MSLIRTASIAKYTTTRDLCRKKGGIMVKEITGIAKVRLILKWNESKSTLPSEEDIRDAVESNCSIDGAIEVDYLDEDGVWIDYRIRLDGTEDFQESLDWREPDFYETSWDTDSIEYEANRLAESIEASIASMDVVEPTEYD